MSTRKSYVASSSFRAHILTQRHNWQFLQQHLNRSLKRYARLTGNVQPSKRALQDKLQKRMAATDPLIGRANRKRSQPERRHKNKSQDENAGYDKTAASGSSSTANSSASSVSNSTDTSLATGNSTDTGSVKGSDTTGKKGKGKKGNGAGNAGAGASNSTDTGASASNSIDTGAAAGNATSTGAAASTSGTSSTAEGFPEIDLEAQTNGGLTAANAPTASDSLGLDIEANDVGYIATVQIGTPPQDFNFLMDTGSADMWVGSEDCTTQGTTQGCVRICAVCPSVLSWTEGADLLCRVTTRSSATAARRASSRSASSSRSPTGLARSRA